MTADEQVVEPESTEKATLRAWFAVAAVGLGVFVFTTTEMVPIGLLTTMSTDLGISEGVTGLTVTLYGVVAGLFAPILTTATRRLDRRTLLIAVLVIFVVGNVATAVSTNFTVLVASRLFTGFAHGVMWSISASIAVRLVPSAMSVRAIAVVFSGISIASVIGVPLGTLIGDAASWRVAFWVIAALGALTLIACIVLVPSLAPTSVLRLSDLPALLRRPTLRIAVTVTAVVVIGHFAAYTYVSPFLEQVSGIDRRWISLLLLAYGVAGVAGNFLASAVIARNLRTALIAFIVGLSSSITLLVLAGSWIPGVILFLLTWGIAYAALPVALQTFVFGAAPDAPEGATSLFIMSFNVAISLGALLGGVAIDSSGPSSVMWIGVGFGAVAALILLCARRSGEKEPA